MHVSVLLFFFFQSAAAQISIDARADLSARRDRSLVIANYYSRCEIKGADWITRNALCFIECKRARATLFIAVCHHSHESRLISDEHMLFLICKAKNITPAWKIVEKSRGAIAGGCGGGTLLSPLCFSSLDLFHALSLILPALSRFSLYFYLWRLESLGVVLHE